MGAVASVTVPGYWIQHRHLSSLPPATGLRATALPHACRRGGVRGIVLGYDPTPSTPTRSASAAFSCRFSGATEIAARRSAGWLWGGVVPLATAPHSRYGCDVIRDLDHAQIAAPPGCEGAARDFFGGDLGLAEIAKPPALLPQGGVWFALADGRELHIGVETTFAPQEKAHLAFAMASAAELTELAARCGSTIDRSTIPGAARFYARDPWGNRLEFIFRG